MLTLSDVAENPTILTTPLDLPSGESTILRPLKPDDSHKLAHFLHHLSAETRRFSDYVSDDQATAQELCDAINRYDKLRFVLETEEAIVGLLEFSFAITEGDINRFANYDIDLRAETDCRFGLCLADHYQSKGVGSLVLPLMADVARKFGKKRMILWGGVLTENLRAIRYYQKNGFELLGTFKNQDQRDCLDMILIL
jgi:diamine N-acetyltransferase